jgi:opacity protein-like surface antigen
VAVSALPGVDVGGDDFEGDTFFRGSSELAQVPDLKSAVGLRVGGGYRLSRAALQLSYERTSHDASFLARSAKATYDVFGFDIKGFLRTDKKLQPYGGVGAALTRLTFDNGVVRAGIPITTRDAIYTGIGVSLEGGAAVFVTPRIGFELGYSYRFAGFSHILNADGEREELPDDGMIGRTGNAVVTAVLIF